MTTEAKGLPVLGYRPTQPPEKVALVNVSKALEERCLRQIDLHRDGGTITDLDGTVHTIDPTKIDQRSVQMARGEIEDAFMRLNRAVFQPQRVALPEDGDDVPA